ncbi:Second ORF in transposon ISC774 [Saccharolobus solfataricus P2]|uniref:Second ORF in transposon ISC774 n=2 Tax=Saccharolobus solfataricus TaxID=2287 RepID=Q97WH7_SACS2|nr:Second ORF in transposon ISC774 [Saccharolobus solfataricus P2]SAI85938.1 partial transposase [Saccharolobus solfataricus]
MHDGLSVYNAFDWFNVGHKRVTLGDYTEEGSRKLKHRVSSMDFACNSNKLMSWFSTFFLIYNLLYIQVYLVDKGVMINANISTT